LIQDVSIAERRRAVLPSSPTWLPDKPKGGQNRVAVFLLTDNPMRGKAIVLLLVLDSTSPHDQANLAESDLFQVNSKRGQARTTATLLSRGFCASGQATGKQFEN
jgi:hypothetical protein